MGDAWQTNDKRVLTARVVAYGAACVLSITVGQSLAGKWISPLVATAVVAYFFGAVLNLWSYFGYGVDGDD